LYRDEKCFRALQLFGCPSFILQVTLHYNVTADLNVKWFGAVSIMLN